MSSHLYFLGRPKSQTKQNESTYWASNRCCLNAFCYVFVCYVFVCLLCLCLLCLCLLCLLVLCLFFVFVFAQAPGAHGPRPLGPMGPIWATGRGPLGQGPGPLGPCYRIHMESVTTYCQADYPLSGKLPTVRQTTYCQS